MSGLDKQMETLSHIPKQDYQKKLGVKGWSMEGTSKSPKMGVIKVQKVKEKE